MAVQDSRRASRPAASPIPPPRPARPPRTCSRRARRSADPRIGRRAFVKLPAGFDGELVAHGDSLRAVVVQGEPRYDGAADEPKPMVPGSYFASHEPSAHPLRSASDRETVLYLRTNGAIGVRAR